MFGLFKNRNKYENDTNFGGIKQVSIYRIPRAIAVVRHWHELFMWEEINAQVHESPPKHIKEFEQDLWEPLEKMWHNTLSRLSDASPDDYIWVSITFSRKENDYSQMLGELQTEAEELLMKMYMCTISSHPDNYDIEEYKQCKERLQEIITEVHNIKESIE